MNSTPLRRFDEAGDWLNRHALPIFLWRSSEPEPSVKPSGTITLISFSGQPLYVTCEHVWREYLEMKRQHEDAVLGASMGSPYGLLALTGLECLDSSREMDLAILHAPQRGHWASVERSFFRVPKWPPPEPQIGELVLVVGYPKYGRVYHSDISVLETGWVSLCYPISSVSDRSLVLANENCTRKAALDGTGIEEEHLGGMSGSPAFICRDGVAHWIGIFYEGRTAFDTVFISRSHFLLAAGRLDHHAIPPGYR